jgi:hypothetical protein
MAEFRHVDNHATEGLVHLADRVRATLIAAGIPAFNIMDPDPQGGAAIDVDTGGDQGGGVYISWSLSRGLTDDINNLLLTNQISDERIQYSGKVRAAMRDAIIAILNAAGISASPAVSDIRALEVSISD